MRKKLMLGLLTAVLAFSVSETSASAAHAARGCEVSQNTCSFVDEDEDGFCDNYDEQLCKDNYVDADCDGVCDFAGAKDGGICYNDCKTDDKANCTVTNDSQKSCERRSRAHHNSGQHSSRHSRGHHGSRRCR